MNIEAACHRARVMERNCMRRRYAKLTRRQLDYLNPDVMDTCYDRDRCTELGLDYSALDREDIMRITVFHALVEEL